MKSSRARRLAVTLGVGVAALAAAPASFANVPAVGSNCQTDGKISGAGSTFQTKAFNNAFVYGYQQDVCGPVGPASNLNTASGGSIVQWTSDPAEYTATVNGASTSVGGMVAYNYSSNSNFKNGSGAGLNRISCRTDMFSGTDLPYAEQDLVNIDSAPGAEVGGASNCQSKLNTNIIEPPYTTGPWPNTSDATKNAMNFPVAGGAVAIAANFNGVCTTVPAAGTPFNLTAAELDGIWQGTINQWNDPTLDATNPFLSTDGCTGNIQRVVRFDNSGTTGLMMQALGAGDLGNNGIDTGTLCDGSTWLSLFQNNPNTTWPDNAGTSANCKDSGVNGAPVAPAPTNSGSNGSGSLITKVENTNGSIGYAELGLWGTPPSGVLFASLRNATDTAFISPGTPGHASTCNIGVRGLPGSGTKGEAVGLGGAGDDWASDNQSASNGGSTTYENVTYQGSQYPVCGLTFDLVYTGMSNESGEVAGSGGTAGCTGSSSITGACQTVTPSSPEAGTTNDALRNEYSFFTYLFSPLGQSYLAQATYDQLPASWLLPLRQGFQQNF